MQLGAGGNLLFIPSCGECLWYLRRILKEVKVCELSALWRKAFQIADSSSNGLRHECAIVWGWVRRPARLEWENEGQRGGGCSRRPGTGDMGPGALLGLVGHQRGSHSRVAWLIYIWKGSSTILPQFKKLPAKRLLLGGGKEEREGYGWRLGPDRPGRSSRSGEKWWASGHIPKSSLAGFTERLDMVYDEFNI